MAQADSSQTEEPTKFTVIGLIANESFQRCRYIVQKLHISYPKKFSLPEIRPMLNVDWDQYLIKMKRRHGKNFYLLFKPVVVFLNGKFLGDDKDLLKYVGKTYSFQSNLDYESICNQELINHVSDIFEKSKRKLVYFTVGIDQYIMGSLLFMLYNDIVPETCENFLKRCENKEKFYKGTRVHRIAKNSWIQCGGWKLEQPNEMPCENYAIPHNRRGVLSMCNAKRHRDNTTQFFVTLEPTPWMDYKYVAFGQLIQGAEILDAIQQVPTYYENPLRRIEFVNCGEFTLCPKPDDDEYVAKMNPLDLELFYVDHKDNRSLGDPDSCMSLFGYQQKKYYLKTDLKSYYPFARYSRMFDDYLRDLMRNYRAADEGVLELPAGIAEQEGCSAGEEEGEEEKPKVPLIYVEEKEGRDMIVKQLRVGQNIFYFVDGHLIV